MSQKECAPDCAYCNDPFFGHPKPHGIEDSRDDEPRHRSGCICADCSDAELTARND